LEREESAGEAETVVVRTAGLSQLLTELDTIPGVSEAEEEVAEYVKSALEGCYESFHTDALGNHFFTKEGTNPQLDLMLSAHMDEVGFVIHHVDEKGFGYFTPVDSAIGCVCLEDLAGAVDLISAFAEEFKETL
jgi:M42 glutamyl aminopeptidase